MEILELKKLYYSNGQLSSEYWNDRGLYNGTYQRWYSLGFRKHSVQYKNGVLNGLIIAFKYN
jgi:antitoxin component YwqK of YwqJK toxin-antitoxin module